MTPLIAHKISNPDCLCYEPFHDLACANWKQYPLAPRTRFKIGHTDSELCILFRVDESRPRAICSMDFLPVNQDSCVEFFCKVPGQKVYYSFGFNSWGTCSAKSRRERVIDVRALDEGQMAMISRKRHVSTDFWEISVTIPFEILGLRPVCPTYLYANFYKCGDLTDRPHYLSWMPINSPIPDFHRPEFFGQVILE